MPKNIRKVPLVHLVSTIPAAPDIPVVTQQTIKPVISPTIPVAPDIPAIAKQIVEPIISPTIPTAPDKEGLRPIADLLKLIPFRGGAITVREKPLLPLGAYSMVQNIRNKHPGMIKRKGQRKLHTTADGSNKGLSLYQFKKSRIEEEHFFAQMSDGDILEATNDPPTVTTGVFGSEVFSGGASQWPGSWGNIGDTLLFSNGIDQHQIYTGTENYVYKFIKFDGSAAPPNVPVDGVDYTDQVTDKQTTTHAVLDSLNTYANNECLFIMTPVPANRLTWTIPKPNGTAAVGTLKYRKSDGTWADTSETDGTISTGATLGQGGAMTWTSPSDEIPCYMYGASGFWYRWETATQLDSEVEVTSLTYGSGFQDIQNVWSGVLVNAIEARFYDASADTYTLDASGSVEIDSMTASDKVYFNSFDLLDGFYIDPGSTPNTTVDTTINSVYVWTGAGWTSLGTITDGTNGLSNAGYVTFARNTDAQPTQFQTAQYYSYWYYFTVDKTLNDDVIIGIQTIPYFDIEELGKGQCNYIWKDRALYSFDKYGQYLYVTDVGTPLVLNGNGYGILQAGDGRSNKVVAMRKFANELMVWQEEKGVEGGCLTLFEGYSPITFGKLLLSDKVGAMNDKCVAVADGVLTSTATDEKLTTLAFFLSRYGVCASDGMSVSIISDDIQNYFDPTQSECIRRGYEKEMWLKHDSVDNVLRLGLVSGSSATVPNIFPVFDLTDKTWSFDVLTQPLSCMAEVEAASGNVTIIQVGCGTADGTIYQLNYGTNDVSTAIDAYATMEFAFGGQYLSLKEILVRMKTQAAGDLTVTILKNALTGDTKTLSMIAETTNQIVRRHRQPLNIVDQHISVKFQNATVDVEMYLHDASFSLDVWEVR